MSFTENSIQSPIKNALINEKMRIKIRTSVYCGTEVGIVVLDSIDNGLLCHQKCVEDVFAQIHHFEAVEVLLQE